MDSDGLSPECLSICVYLTVCLSLQWCRGSPAVMCQTQADHADHADRADCADRADKMMMLVRHLLNLLCLLCLPQTAAGSVDGL